MVMMKLGNLGASLHRVLSLLMGMLLRDATNREIPVFGSPRGSNNPHRREPAAANRNDIRSRKIRHCTSERLQRSFQLGNVLLITFSDLPPPPLGPFDQESRRWHDPLIYNRVFKAVGKRTGDLEKEIRIFMSRYFIK